MAFIQELIPKEEPATENQEWPFTIWEFIVGNWFYLLLILVILLIFLYTRHKRKQRLKNRFKG